MSTTEIREEIQHFIKKADEPFLRAVYELIRYAKNIDVEFGLSETQKRILDERKRKHLNGASKSFSK